MNIEPGWIVAVGAVISALVSVGAQWVRYEGLIATCRAEGTAALQTAAEALEEVRSFTDERDQARRDIGESLHAIRDHMHQFETWARDEFVRKDSFRDWLARSDRASEQIVERIEKRLERIELKLDERN